MSDKNNTIFGIYPVKEALSSNVNFDKVFIQKGIDSDKIEGLIKDLEKANVTINIVPFEKLNRLTRGNHQGIVAVTSPVGFHSLESVVEKTLESNKTPLFLILDQITDVRNFGAILRTAECTGVDAVIIQKSGGAPVSGDTVKTSAGAIFNLPICKEIHFGSTIEFIQSCGVKLVASTEQAKDTIYQTDLTGPIAIIMGDEGAGVHPKTLEKVNHVAKIPMGGKVASLNVAVAAGMILSEVERQQNFK